MLLYIAAGMAACRPHVEPLVPLPLVPVSRDSAVAWASRTVPPTHTALRLRWSYQDAQVRWSGRATARIAPPDTLRLDFAGPLGIGAGAGVVVGDSVAWTDPPGSLERLVPAIPMLWAAFGTVRPPPEGGVAFTRARATGDERVLYWRLVHGADTLDYAQRSGSAWELEAEWRRTGALVARSRVRFDPRRRPTDSRIDFPTGPARIEFTVTAVDTAAAFPALLWHRQR